MRLLKRFVFYFGSQPPEAVAQRYSVKNVFLKISQNSQENPCAGVSFLIKLQAYVLAQVFCCEFCEIFKNTLFYRTPPAATSEPRFQSATRQKQSYKAAFTLIYKLIVYASLYISVYI